MPWQPTLGARPDATGVHFRVWAPKRHTVELIVESGPAAGTHLLTREPDGHWHTHVPGARAGDLYRYRVDGEGPFPDPASRYQPRGVHGPSQVMDGRAFVWKDQGWKCPPLAELVTYELHVGTFSPEGTFAGAAERLPYLADLGVSAVELMPLADFPGSRNWGYDGVSLFAPPRCYGTPDDLRRLVDRAHSLGLAVILDVVYNHLGPDGNYLGVYSPDYFTDRHHNTWGKALNFDGPGSPAVRNFFIENALHWAHEYHFDGFRFDATHCIFDDSPEPILAEIVRRLRDSFPGRRLLLMAEDHRNLALIAQPTSQGGWGFDAIWADDFHHQVRRLLHGDHESYYGDFTGITADLARTVEQGWFYTGQHSEHLGGLRGTDPTPLDYSAFVVCIQNHDQTGNRAMGERLHHQIDLAAWRAASALLLAGPCAPLLWMGQEWAATSPFQFFTDHHEELGRLVTQGRRKEFEHFSDFTDPARRERIPDPQAESTIEASRLRWDELRQAPHAQTLSLYKALLRLRRELPALRYVRRGFSHAVAVSGDGVALLRRAPKADDVLLFCHLRGQGVMDLTRSPLAKHLGSGGWKILLHTEQSEFAPDPQPPRIDPDGNRIEFHRPGAVLLSR